LCNGAGGKINNELSVALSRSSTGITGMKDFLDFDLIPFENDELIDGMLAYIHPDRISTDDFLSALEEWVLNHDILEHSFFKRLKMGEYGSRDKSAALMLRFLEGYGAFTSSFTGLLETLIDQIDVPCESLLENLEEENGAYDDETLERMVQLGMDPDLIAGIPHKQLFSDMLQKMRNTDGVSSELTNIPSVEPLGSKLGSEFRGLVWESVDSGFGALYFGSELIAPKMYTNILRAIDYSYENKLTFQEKSFFTLHIDLDEYHSDNMKAEMINLGIASSLSSRISLMKTVYHIMTERHRFVTYAAEALTSRPTPILKPGSLLLLLIVPYILFGRTMKKRCEHK